MKTTGPTNPEIQRLIAELRKTKKPAYLDLARKLAVPRRKKEGVNVSKINKLAQKDEGVAVPGKVLAGGEMTKPVCVYAVSFSKTAEEKIRKAGGKTLSIYNLLEKKENARIII